MDKESAVITKETPPDDQRESRLLFLEQMDQINSVIEGTEDWQQLSRACDVLVAIFRCDRVWIARPYDPEHSTWRPAIVCGSPEFFGSSCDGLELPMDAELAQMHRVVMDSRTAVGFAAGAENPIAKEIAERFGVRSQLCLSIHPKADSPYIFGLDRCTSVQTWSEAERRLFEATGQRLAMLLTRWGMVQELQESKARLEEAQRVARVGHWEWDLETGVIVWSDESYRIFGFRPQERPMDLATVRAIVHPDDRESLYGNVDKDLAAGVLPDAEFRIVLASGEIRRIQALTSKHWGAPAGYSPLDLGDLSHKLFGTMQDITDRKREEEERQALSRKLQESKAWLEEAQRVAHIGYWIWDLDKNQVIYSDETCRIFGLPPQEGPIDLAIVSERIHPDDRERVFRQAEEAIRSGTRVDTVHRIVRPDGEVRTIEALGDLKKDASGRPYQMFGTTQDITDRKRVEEDRQTLSSALQQSNARLEDAQRVAHIGHYEWKPHEHRVTWSDELYRIYGLPPGKGPIDMAMVFEMVHPEDRERVAREADEAVRSGTPFKAEHRIVRPNGEVRFVQALGAVKRDASGQVYEMFGTGQDITDRKLAEQTLRRNQFYLSEGERLAHVGSWASTNLGISWGDDLGLYWSDELYRIFGLDPKNGALGLEQCLAYVHPQDRAVIAEKVKAMHEEHCICDVTHRIVRPDGEVRYIRVVSNPVVEQGAFKGYIGTTIDVTEQELLTRESRRQQAYLNQAQSLVHIGSWATNLATGHIHHISDETLRVHGFDPREGPVPLERFFNTLHPEDEPAVRARLENAVRTGTDYDIREFRICRPDGVIRFLRTIGHRDPSQEIGEYIGITADITERKRSEEEHERLRQLEADLAHINRVNMMGELAAALAHEIKQPIAASITSASACLRWLAHDPPDLERARGAAARIEQEGNRADDIINSLRSFYKTGTSAERQPVDVKGAIREMTALLGTEAARHAVTIHAVSEADMPHILADRVQLQQVLMNLMLNSIEAMKDTGGELTIRSHVNPEGQLNVSVSDTGVGLPAEGTDLIFDPFHTTKPQGTGMGLTITRSIVESYGGRVWATTNQEAGATFHFTLPAGTEGEA